MKQHEDKGWIGVDFDGTLFTYDKWVGWNVFGEPINPMVDRVKAWVAEGVTVKIVTARIGLPTTDDFGVVSSELSTMRMSTCYVTGDVFSNADMAAAVQDHLFKHGMPRLAVQCYKDVHMRELWDDRAVQVVPNTGRTLADEHEARLSAMRGKVAQQED